MRFFQKELCYAGFTKRSIFAFSTMSTTGADYKTVFDKTMSLLGTGATLGFLGDRGTGKTVMSAAIACKCLNMEPPHSVFYTTAHRLFMRFKDCYRDGAEESETRVHEAFRLPDLLVIDEVGRRQETDWENRTLIDLADGRYGDIKDTIFISNQEKEVFDEALGDSIVSRMTECGGCLIFNWPSFRK